MPWEMGAAGGGVAGGPRALPATAAGLIAGAGPSRPGCGCGSLLWLISVDRQPSWSYRRGDGSGPRAPSFWVGAVIPS